MIQINQSNDRWHLLLTSMITKDFVALSLLLVGATMSFSIQAPWTRWTDTVSRKHLPPNRQLERTLEPPLRPNPILRFESNKERLGNENWDLRSTKGWPRGSVSDWIRSNLSLFPWHRLPNMLTYTRCLAIPAMVVLFYLPGRHIETSLLFALASFTDWLDGYLARLWNITSDFGAFLDPVADKLMVSTALLLLTGRHGPIVAIPAAIILAREISVSALREWMAQRRQRDIVKVGFQGKLKTAVTMLSLALLLLLPEKTSLMISPRFILSMLLLYLSMILTLTSGGVYFVAAAPLLSEAPVNDASSDEETSKHQQDSGANP